MLEYPTFFHISSKNPDDADIANRKHYSAPEGALTKFLATGWSLMQTPELNRRIFDAMGDRSDISTVQWRKILDQVVTESAHIGLLFVRLFF